MTIDEVKKVFYSLVEDADTGMTLDIYKNDFEYVRFNYFEEGKPYNKEYSDEEYFGNDDKVDEEYEAEFSNGSVNYIPTLKVEKPEEFFINLHKLISKYVEFYNLDRGINKFGKETVIKNIIQTILSNARYQDYENPMQYFEKYNNFFNDTTLTKYENTIIAESIPSLGDGAIVVNNEKDNYGYETPYSFNISIKNNDVQYNLPIINYGISGDTCYIYSVQNKKKNDENTFNKKVKRNLNKVNSGVENDTDYEVKDTILGTTPSFITAMAIFFDTLKKNNIDKVRVTSFLPDRYMEKIATSEYDADEVQHNLTEKMALLFYRLQHHIPKLEVNFPIYDGYILSDDKEVGEDLIIKLPEKIECNNNAFLNELLSSINHKKLENEIDPLSY